MPMRFGHGHNLRSAKLPSSATIRNVSVSSVAASKAKAAAAPACAAACVADRTIVGSEAKEAADSCKMQILATWPQHTRSESAKQGMQVGWEALIAHQGRIIHTRETVQESGRVGRRKDLPNVSAAVAGCPLSRLGLERDEDDVLRLALHLHREDASRPRERQHLQPSSGAPCQLAANAILLLVSFLRRTHSSALMSATLRCCSCPHDLAQIVSGLPDELQPSFAGSQH